MKKFIQKTTSVFMSLAMAALIGAPAYATMAENEPEQIKPEIIESVLPDIASEKATPAVDFIGNTATESDAVPSADNSTEEEADTPEEKSEITYIDNLSSVYSAGADNLINGMVLSGIAVIGAIPLCMIPFGALAVFAGIPGGFILTVIGAGELATAPIIAAFMDENTNLEPIDGFDAEEILSLMFENN